MKSLKSIFTGNIYGDESLLTTAPKYKRKQPLTFFTIGKYLTEEQLQKEYDARHLLPANPYDLAEYMEVHQDEDWKATQWKDNDGKYCCAAFNRWDDGRGVDVRRRDGDWRGGWSFAGVPEVASGLDFSESTLTLESFDARLKKLEAIINPELLK